MKKIFSDYVCYPNVKYHKLTANTTNYKTTIILPIPTSTVVLNDITEGSTYTIEIAASNDIGMGPVTTTTIGK